MLDAKMYAALLQALLDKGLAGFADALDERISHALALDSRLAPERPSDPESSAEYPAAKIHRT